MRVKNWFAASVLLPGLCLGVFPAFAQQQQSQASPAQQSGDPVADAARKAREQQKAAPKPKKVYTDDDVKPATPASDAAAPASGGVPSWRITEQGRPRILPVRERATTRKKSGASAFRISATRLPAAEKELDILQREDDKAQVQYYSDPTKAMNEQYSRKDINDKNAKIERKNRKLPI